jgi:hypothetical protein
LIAIPGSVEIINGFSESAIKRIIFVENCVLREIQGSQQCVGLEAVESPANVEIINGYSESAVKRIAFSENCAVKEIDGFQN